MASVKALFYILLRDAYGRALRSKKAIDIEIRRDVDAALI